MHKLHKLFRPYSIYRLECNNGNILYVGKTQGLLQHRLREHLQDQVHPTKRAIFQSIIEAGGFIRIRECGKIVGSQKALKLETYWINYYIKAGHSLCNVKQVKAK